MSTQLFQQGYKEMSHSGAEGRFLDITDSSERFDLYLSQVDWLDKNTKLRLLGLAQGYIKRFSNLNPYAYAIGYFAVTTDDKNNLIITKDSLSQAYKLLNRSNQYDVYLSDLIDKSDILRYARLYIKTKTKSDKEGGVLIQGDEPTENEMVETFENDFYYDNEEGEYNEDDYYNDGVDEDKDY